MNKIKLRRCPFCGGNAGKYQDYHCLWIIQCNQCGCGTLYKPEVEEAAKIWNRRYEDGRKCQAMDS